MRNLPPNTQEGLLQQALEKHAQVKRVEVFQDINEADVELENAAVCLHSLPHPNTELTSPYHSQEAGKLLLRPDSIVFNGNTLQIVAESTTGPPTARPLAPPAANAGLFVPRAAVSRPRAGLGSRQRGLGTVQASGSAAASASNASAPQAPSGGASKGQDDFRKMLLGGK